MLEKLFFQLAAKNGLVFAFVFICFIMFAANRLSLLTKGKLEGSAIAITAGLALAYAGGVATGGHKGLADIALFSGLAMMGGSMFRDFTIVAMAFGADLGEIKKCGVLGVVSLLAGTLANAFVGTAIGWLFGYRDAVSLVTLGAGACSFIVGPVTGAAIGASSEVIAISIATGVIKTVFVMLITPVAATIIDLKTPAQAMIFGGMIGTTSGVAAGLASINPKLVPYGAMTSTFRTGVGCLFCPSVYYLGLKALLG